MKIKKISKKEILQHQIPDIDIDIGEHPISNKNRHDVIYYLIEKYGEDHVCFCGNKNKYSLKSIIRDLGQVYDIPFKDTVKCTKNLDDSLPLEVNIQNNPEISSYFEKYEKKIPNFKEKIEKINSVNPLSSLGIHAGGVIITSKKFPINFNIAIQKNATDNHIASLWNKEELAFLKYVKIDLLGVDAISNIHLARELLNLNPYEDFPPNDSKVFEEIFSKGYNNSIFQFESSLGKRALLDCKPANINELSIVNAIIRILGSSSGIEAYNLYKQRILKYKSGDIFFWEKELRKEIEDDYLFEICKDVLKETLGVLIYQEQLILLVNKISKKSFVEGNLMRKKLEKLSKTYSSPELLTDINEIKKWHSEFFKIINEYIFPYLGKDGPEAKRQDIVDFINCKIIDNKLVLPKNGILKWLITAATYLFNKSHSIAYSLNAYQQAYLKYYYPEIFWLSSLICKHNQLDKIKNIIEGIKKESSIEVLRPDINKSDIFFSLEKDSEGKSKIRFGLSSILNLSKDSASLIVEERKNGGLYKNLDDFLNRLKGKINKKIIEALFYSGAFLSFEVDSNSKLETKILIEAQKKILEKLDKLKYNNLSNEFDKMEEKFIGLSLSFKDESKNLINKNLLNSLTPIEEIKEENSSSSAITKIFLVGVKVLSKKKKTKNSKDFYIYKVLCLLRETEHFIFDFNNTELKENGEYVLKIRLKNGFLNIIK